MASSHVDFIGNPAVAWRYMTRAPKLGRSYALKSAKGSSLRSGMRGWDLCWLRMQRKTPKIGSHCVIPPPCEDGAAAWVIDRHVMLGESDVAAGVT